MSSTTSSETLSGVQAPAARHAPQARAADQGALALSIVIPVHNELPNVATLHQELREALEGAAGLWEIVFVDDGSTDGTFEVLRGLAERDPRTRVARLAHRYGQTAALSAGFDLARGELTITLDGDRQNDPADIPKLLEKLAEGYDVVSGWRWNRQDAWLTKTLPSQIANRLISWVTGVRLHDYGCTLKVYRTSYLKEISLYGEMHRFIPVFLHLRGARIAELRVNHRPRVAGATKYRPTKTVRVILDLITVKFLESYSTKPIHVFGGLGIWLCFAGLLAGAVTLAQKYAYGIWAHRNPLLLLAIFLFILGAQCIMMGLLAEIGIRTYHESQQKRPYTIRDVIG